MLQVGDIGFKYKKSNFELKNVSFSLEDGYMLCLIGKNGSGKTTLLNAIYGIIKPTSGCVIFDYKKVVAAKNNAEVEENVFATYHKQVAYVGDVNWLMTGVDIATNINLLKTLYDNFDEKEFDRLLAYFEFDKSLFANEYRILSTGQRMQLQLAFSFARHPRLMILDEPFANLDPVVKTDLSELLQKKITEDNISVIISTHLVDDISNMVDYIGVIENGEMVKYGDRVTLLENKGVETLREFILGGDR